MVPVLFVYIFVFSPINVSYVIFFSDYRDDRSLDSSYSFSAVLVFYTLFIKYLLFRFSDCLYVLL